MARMGLQRHLFFTTLAAVILLSVYTTVLLYSRVSVNHLLYTDSYIQTHVRLIDPQITLHHEIPIPALIIAGPAKTGTTSLLHYFTLYPDVFAYPHEHHYFALPHVESNPGYCGPNMTASQWQDYLYNNYQQNNGTLTSLLDIIRRTNSDSTRCNATQFEDTYQQLTLHTDCGNTSCWFFEKTPSYGTNPFVPLWIANILPRVKYLTILRNPVTHVWSNYCHLGDGGAKRWAPDRLGAVAREERIINQYKNVSSIRHLNGMCDAMWMEYKQIKDLYPAKQRYLRMRKHYKRFVIEYWKRQYVEPKDIHRRWQPDLSKVVWNTYIVPVLLIGLLANDEAFIGNWDGWDPMKNEMLNYRYVQFEWLWNDTLDSMRTMRCWMTQGQRINNNKCEFDREDPMNHKLFGSLNKTNSRAVGEYSSWYIQEIKRIMSPCNNLISNALLNDRPQLLLGQWLQRS